MKKVINMDTGEVFESIKAAAAKYGCTNVTISNNVRGKTKTAVGFHWQYYKEKSEE